MSKRQITIMIIPEGSTRSFRKRFSYTTLFTLLVAALVLIGAFVFMIVNYSRVYYVALQAEILRHRNAKLEQQWKKITRIEKDLALIKRTDQRIRKLLGADKSPSPPVLPSSEGASTLYTVDIAPVEAVSVEENPGIAGERTTPLEKIPSIWPARGWISRLYSQEHTAIDIAAPTGTPVVSTTSDMARS
jgi:murein DD-endopeptidase MepM/ murein hydrolase activator NlpD